MCTYIVQRESERYDASATGPRVYRAKRTIGELRVSRRIEFSGIGILRGPC